ncbi:4'-phosphopantetheinyl transferase superfamily protein [Nostoc sp. NMS8]|uniref:4'-phosphopantetheinyl transferase family protein n=1 Tax=Nostoc sp. NMS8 TaxID=2815392 RepID=UPI0025F220B9|nr:4'-phosphopantetheinyl transferase superfamily protein [Nostoc sp. NMS8]MBN3957680.1 4'-phosphopantetheinyl transferase superfamily protein [Nostoc sp. NMS8]
MPPSTTYLPEFAKCLPMIAAIDIDIGADLAIHAEDYLSPKELAHFHQFKHSRRRHEWFTARLVCKLLFSRYLSNTHLANSNFVWPPTIQKFGCNDIATVLPLVYRSIEVLPSNPSLKGASQLFWQGNILCTVYLSITHAGGWAIASLSCSGPVGLDVEEPIFRRPDFYESYFSKQEILWVQEQIKDDLSISQLYTLLWTLKESYLKTGRSPINNICDFCNLEVKIYPSLFTISKHLPEREFNSQLHILKLQFSYAKSTFAPHAAFSIMPNLVLSMVAFDFDPQLGDVLKVFGEDNSLLHKQIHLHKLTQNEGSLTHGDRFYRYSPNF